MSEPVGNSQRVPIPGNSHKSREAKSDPQKVPGKDDKLTKVIEGVVVQKKAPVMKRMVRGLVADDINNVGEFLVTDVLLPSFRNLLFDLITQGSARTLFGSTGARRSLGGAGPVSSIRTAYNKIAEGNPSDIRRSAQPVRRRTAPMELIILETREEALAVLDALMARVERFGRASKADLNDLLGITGEFTDQNWGWTNLDQAGVSQSRDGYLLDFPDPIDIR